MDKTRLLEKLRRTGFFHIFGVNVINKILGFGNTIILVRILTRQEYGLFAYAMNIYGWVLLFQGLRMDSAALQLLSEKRQDKDFCQRVMRQSTIWGGTVSLALGVILLGIGLWMPLTFPETSDLFYLLCLLPLCQFIYNLMCTYLRTELRNQDFSQMSLLYTLVSVVVGIGGAYLFRVKGLILGLYLAAVAAVLWGYFRLKLRIDFGAKPLPATDKRSLWYIGLISVFNDGVSAMLYMLDIFVLGIYFANEQILAGYKTATLIPFGLLFIPSALVTYIYPYFANHNRDGHWCLDNYRRLLKWFGSFNLGLATVMCFFAPQIVSLVFGTRYLDVVPIFQILAANYFFSATFRNVAGNLLVTQRKLKFNFYVALLCGLVNIPADILFIKWWGGEGAALATLLVTIISGILCTGYLVRVFKKQVTIRK